MPSQLEITHTSQMIPRLLAQVQAGLPRAPENGAWPTEVLLFTQLPVAEAQALIEQAAEQMISGEAPGHRLLLLEHPATLAFAPGCEHLLKLDEAACREHAITRLEDSRISGAEYAGPGMLFAYLT